MVHLPHETFRLVAGHDDQRRTEPAEKAGHLEPDFDRQLDLTRRARKRRDPPRRRTIRPAAVWRLNEDIRARLPEVRAVRQIEPFRAQLDRRARLSTP